MTVAVKRAAIYARVSTDDQDIEVQLRVLRPYVEQRGWTWEIYEDRGVSGAKDQRPALDRLMTHARAHTLDVVVVWKFDRFARSTKHLLLALDEFRALEVDFVSVTEAIDTSTALGRAMFTIVGAIAELERELIRERIKAGVAKARADGKHLGRPQRWTRDQMERAAKLRSEGRSWRTIARSVGLPVRTIRRAIGARP